ncbi:MAG: DeoR/GlpR family DNA-binding transcription regulator [Planctomycetes bacterium]|nr:DeoR/GlpR family DNA-binding transcription regulator [Planctomycetota bacterium]
MLIVERQERVLEILKQRKAAQLEDLARELDVSASTIRRDLEQLEAKGVVERTHGGAVYRGDSRKPELGAGLPSIALAERMTDRIEEKMLIGRYAAAQVRPQMTVLLDGGSTVIYAARQITARPIQVVTNSLAIANIFAEEEQVELLLIGGSLYPRTGVLVGPVATGCLADLHADVLLFSLACIYGDEAFNHNLAMSQVEQAMMRQAARSVMLMDSSKFGRKSLARVCGLNEVDQVVTDPGIDPAVRDSLGSRLVVAEPGR